MHKRYLLLLVATFFGLSSAVSAQSLSRAEVTGATPLENPVISDRGGIELTQSKDFGVFSGGVRCGSSAGGYSTENSFFRVFDLSEVDEITEGFAVNQVSAGISIAAWPEGTPTQTGLIRLHTLAAAPDGGVFLLSDLSLVSEAEFELDGPASTFLLQEVETTGNFAPDDLMAVEMFLPTGNPKVNTELVEPFSIAQGGNDLGTTDTEYLASESCGIVDPTDLTELGDFQSEWVLIVSGTNAAGTASEEGVIPESLAMSLFPNPVASAATLQITLDTPERVAVTVYDVTGREIATLHEGAIGGQRTFEFDTSAFTSGVYVVQLRGESFSTTRKFIVID